MALPLARGGAVKRIPDWDTQPVRAYALMLWVMALAVLDFAGCRCARLRLWRLAREYGFRRQYLRQLWRKRKVQA